MANEIKTTEKMQTSVDKTPKAPGLFDKGIKNVSDQLDNTIKQGRKDGKSGEEIQKEMINKAVPQKKELPPKTMGLTEKDLEEMEKEMDKEELDTEYMNEELDKDYKDYEKKLKGIMGLDNDDIIGSEYSEEKESKLDSLRDQKAKLSDEQYNKEVEEAFNLDKLYEKAGGDEEKMLNMYRDLERIYETGVTNSDIQGIIEAYMEKKTGKPIWERYKPQ